MKTKIYTGLGPFVKIKPGKFIMGSPVDEPGRCSDEAQHEVVISKAFELGASPVTQREWVGMMGSNPSHRKDMDAPVEMVSWDDAQEFIRKINAWQDVYTYRLPTEAEWEYAARAGTTGPRPFELKDIDAHAWYYGNSNDRTHPVAQKKSNPWGLYDMIGNVYEWCQDVYADDYSSPASGSYRVLRGGSFYPRGAGYLRADYRGYDDPAPRYDSIGFRLARSAPLALGPLATRRSDRPARKGQAGKHWTDDRIDKLDKLIAAARDLADLELSEDIPESWKTEWLALRRRWRHYNYPLASSNL